MSLARQGKLFLAMGILQWLVDWLVTVLLSQAGLSLELANVLGRVTGAMLGFWLNGWFTFARPGAVLGGSQLLRFLCLWLVLTAVSTAAMSAIGHHSGLQRAWLAKPLVEAGLAVISFFLSRHWVYR